MAPIRRYLRITKYSALEVRIYLEKPSDTPWLLSTRDPALPKIIKLIRPKVLPKLREENQNAKKKGGKKRKNIKDVAAHEDFEVIMFLTDTSTRHSLITKQKHVADKPRLKSTGSKMTGHLKENAIDLSKEEEDDDDNDVPGLRREDSEDADLSTVPAANDALFVQSSDDDEEPMRQRQRAARDNQDDKKKMALHTTYDSFSIYGKILCLIVKRRAGKGKVVAATPAAQSSGPQMMEHWVSTQADLQADMDDQDG